MSASIDIVEARSNDLDEDPLQVNASSHGGETASIDRSDISGGAVRSGSTGPEPVAGTSSRSSSEVRSAILPGASTSNKATSEAGITLEGNCDWLSYSDLMSDSYPAKSKLVYLKAFKLLEKFLKSKNQWVPNTCPTDIQVLNYFHYLRHELKWAPTTLWSTYARINAVMKRLYGVSLNS